MGLVREVPSVETPAVREVRRNLAYAMAPKSGPDWKRIPPERRGRWGRFLVEQRWAHGDLTQTAVRDMLAKMGAELSGPYYSDMETGKAIPSAYWQDVFKRLWNAEPAEDEPVVTEGGPADLSALVAALDRQTAAINALVERFADPAETAAVVAQTVLAMLRANGVLGESPGRSESAALLPGQG